MEDYLQYMKTLRSQMNDVEDQTAMVSVEEQTQITTVQTLQQDLDSAKSEVMKLKEEIELMIKAKGNICACILEKQKRVGVLVSDSSTLSQTLDLIQQEKANLSSKLREKSAYYSKAVEELSTKLQQQQNWLSSRTGGDKQDHGLVILLHWLHFPLMVDENEANEQLLAKLEAAKVKLDEMIQRKSELISGTSKLRQCLEQVKSRANDFKVNSSILHERSLPQLLAMDISTLEEEKNVVVSEKAGEKEYLLSLKKQVESLKGISHVFKCACGAEYKVATDGRCA
ncbi:hypothetical protein ACFE04_025699 [Oxalis oulophora]